MRAAPPVAPIRNSGPARGRLLILAIGLIFSLLSAGGRGDNGKRPRVFLIVCDALTLNDLDLGGSSYPQLKYIAEHGALGLMNCAVAGPKTDTAAMLALAAGQQTPSEATDEMAANDWEKAPGERVSAAESHRQRLRLALNPADTFDPQRSVKHLGIPYLRVRGLDGATLGAQLADASPPVKTWIVGNADTAGWRRRATLLTVDKQGVGAGMVALRSYDSRLPYGLADSPPALLDYALQSDADLVVIHLGDGSRAEAARHALSEPEYRQAHLHAVRMLNALAAGLRARIKPGSANILIVSPRPPASDAGHPDAWNALTPILGLGPNFPPGEFASPTTRTPGLISNTDVAPTLLALYHIPTPPSMTGRPMRVVPDSPDDVRGERRIKRIARIEFIAWTNSAALAPILGLLGVFCTLAAVAGVASLRLGIRAAAGLFALCLAVCMNFPAAQMLAPILVQPTIVEYGIRLAAWMLALTALSYGLARLLRVSLPVAACLMNIVAVLADLVTGQHLLKDALISNYYLPGFRYYGLGNDYLGLLLGFAIAATFSHVDDCEQRVPASSTRTDAEPPPLSAYRLPDRLKAPGALAETPNSDAAAPSNDRDVDEAPQDFDASDFADSVSPQTVGVGWQSAVAGRLLPGILLGWMAMAFIMGWPGWGANAGSIIITSAAFGAIWRTLRGGRWTWLTAAGFTLIGTGLSFGVAYVDARLHGTESAHAGTVLKAAGAGRGAQYLWAIAERKLLFNLSLFASPWTWFALCFIGGILILTPLIADQQVYETLRRRVWLARSFVVVAVTAVASLLFKDSGIVTVCYLVGSVLLVGFYYVLSPIPPAWLNGRPERN